MRTIKKRRRENKTDYNARLKLLKSGENRIVVRRTNKYLIAQLVESEESKDKVILGVTSKDLLAYGWDKKNEGSLKSIPASYFTGLLLGTKTIKQLKGTPILDLGLTRNVKKGRVYSVLNGLVDAGVKIKHKKETFPDEKRLRGEHLKNKINFDGIKKNILKDGK
jgi:large subunit ribosomal protein L18